MGRGTGLHPHLRTRGEVLAQRIEPLASPQLRPPPGLIVAVHRMYLKNGLRNIHTGSDKLHLGLLLIL